jgi:hypothetical protein
MLSSELRKRIDTPDAEDVSDLFIFSTETWLYISMHSLNLLSQLIDRLRHSARLVADLPPDLQQKAKDSYAVSLRAVFILAACATFLAFVVRLPVR